MILNRTRILTLALLGVLSQVLLACAAEPESVIDPPKDEFLKPSSAELAIKDAEPDGAVTATVLFEEYNRDKSVADKKYKGKVFIISGMIGQVYPDWDDIKITLLSEETIPDWVKRYEDKDLPLTLGEYGHGLLPGVKLSMIERSYVFDRGIEFRYRKRIIIKGIIEGAAPRKSGDKDDLSLGLNQKEKGVKEKGVDDDPITAQKPLDVYVKNCVVINRY